MLATLRRHAASPRHLAPLRPRGCERRPIWRCATPRCWPGSRSKGRRRGPGSPSCSGRAARPTSPAMRCASACSSSSASSASSWSAATRRWRWPRASAHDLADSQQVLGDAGDELGPELVAWLAQQRERRGLRAQAALEASADAAERAATMAPRWRMRASCWRASGSPRPRTVASSGCSTCKAIAPPRCSRSTAASSC